MIGQAYIKEQIQNLWGWTTTIEPSDTWTKKTGFIFKICKWLSKTGQIQIIISREHRPQDNKALWKVSSTIFQHRQNEKVKHYQHEKST